MYGVKQRSNGPTRLIGLSIAALTTAVFGYALMSGLAQDIVRVVQTETELAIISPPPVEVPPAPEETKPEEVKVDQPVPELIPIPEFIPPVEEPTIVAPPEPVIPVIDTAAIAPTAGTNRVAPKLRSTDKPPYPTAAQRAHEQGTTGIEVCVSPNGRVASASLAASSGSPRLDEAALKWVRGARFSPGTIGGVPQSMCGHEVFYQWNLEDA